jgi:hypothetical protein
MTTLVRWFIVLICLLAPVPVVAQEPPDEADTYDFWLSEDFVRRLASDDTIMFRMRVSMNHRTGKVHSLADDCEIHIATTTANQLGWPSAVVVEPPNLCKERAPGMPASSEKKLREELWPKHLDQNVMNRECDVTGFPRIFTEHASGNEDPANPNHVLEIHPALRIECDGTKPLLMEKFLKVYKGMRKIKPATSASCLENRSCLSVSGTVPMNSSSGAGSAATSRSFTPRLLKNGSARSAAGILRSAGSRLSGSAPTR